jgi:pre-mRNA-splicing helicase BRR2
MIASYYYIEYTTMELFASSLTAKTKIRGVLEILSSASEYSRMTIRQSEEQQLKKLAKHLPNPIPANAKFEDSSTKTLILLQAYFSQIPLSSELAADQTEILMESLKLLQSMVDVTSSQGWLKPALAAMEASQMMVQGIWDKDPILLQIPHFTNDLVTKLNSLESPVDSVFKILEMEDDDREALLVFPPDQLSDIALFCNSYPNIELAYELVRGSEEEDIVAGDTVQLKVKLARDVDEDEDDEEAINALGRVVCPRYPNKEKREGWWLVVGDPHSNSLLSVKRIALVKTTTVKMEFTAPETAGDYCLRLFLMCDSYLGCDQEYDIPINVVPGEDD